MTGDELTRYAERARRAEAARRLHPDDRILAQRADEARAEYERARSAWLQANGR